DRGTRHLEDPELPAGGPPTCFLPLDPAARNIGFGGKLKFTYTLVHVDIAVFLCCIIANNGFASLKDDWMLGPQLEVLGNLGGMYGPWVRAGSVWRVLWAIFMHAGLLHLLANLAVWIPLGRILEPDWGWFRFTSIFLGSGVYGNLVSVALDNENLR